MSGSYRPTFNLYEGEEFVECPYNISHQITNVRFLTHLDKCRRNYLKECELKGQEPSIVSCRFNDLHRMHIPEIGHHEKTCPDQYRVIQHMSYHVNHAQELTKDVKKSGSSKSTKRSRKDLEKTEAEKDEEDWEGSEEMSGYDPKIKLNNNLIMYVPRGLSKSERKKFREEQAEKAVELGLAPPKIEVKKEEKLDIKIEVTDTDDPDEIQAESTNEPDKNKNKVDEKKDREKRNRDDYDNDNDKYKKDREKRNRDDYDYDNDKYKNSDKVCSKFSRPSASCSSASYSREQLKKIKVEQV